MLHSVILKDVTAVLAHYSFPPMHFCFTSSYFRTNASRLTVYISNRSCIYGSLWLVFFAKKICIPHFFLEEAMQNVNQLLW